MSEYKDWQNEELLEIEQLGKEIESLRSQLDTAVAEVGKMGRELGKAQVRGDKWKRRAHKMMVYMDEILSRIGLKAWDIPWLCFIDDNPEAAQWFEEKSE